MEMMNVISVLALVVVLVVGVALKRFTRRTLSDMDGMGNVTAAQEAETIAKF